MTPQQYYSRVQPQLERSFSHAHYVVAAGEELLADGWDPGFLVAVAPTEEISRFTLEKGMQVHLPVVGRRSRSVLMPLDIEVFLEGENHLLYTDKAAQRRWFSETLSALRHLTGELRSRGLPYLLDYTPSGAHILWQNPIDHRATRAVADIGPIEPDVVAACDYVDPNDIKRWWGISREAARTFSGLGRLTEYLSLRTIAACTHRSSNDALPVTISDTLDRCVNLDNSWCEGSPFMRSIRSPFSLHKKNQQKYGMRHLPPLVDVIGEVFDGNQVHGETHIDVVIDCMWDLDRAADHAGQFSGEIPEANEHLIDLVDEYRRSDLHDLHERFDKTVDLPRGEAVARARRQSGESDILSRVLAEPNPLALQPKNMLRLVRDLVSRGWEPKHVGNVFRDLYIDPGYAWSIDFFKYPAEEKANFWARTFASLVALQQGRLRP